MKLDSVCPLDCPDRCSLSVEVQDGRVKSVGGSKKNPLTAGYICKKVADFGERVHGDLRVRHPMRRVGAKGEGRFERISWEEALDEVARRFAAVAARDPEAILPVWYAGSNGYLTGGGLDARLWHRLGAARLERTLCASNAGAAARAVYGDLPSADLLDVGEADLIVLWGFNPHASGIHLVPLVEKARKRGARLIVVDPRRIPFAEKADLHIAPLPGTDVALAMAILGLAFTEGRADRAFLAAESADAEALEAEARAWTPARAAALCGVDEAEIHRFVELYAAATPAIVRCGWGVERTRNGTDSIRAILSLPAVFGKFGRRGGGYAMSTSGGYKGRLGPLQRTTKGRDTKRSVNLAQLAEALENEGPERIEAIYVYDNNPVATVPDQGRLTRALAREDLFTVVHEQVWTDTCAFADIVLPATTFLEHEELTRSYASYIFQWSTPVVPAEGEARSNHEVFAELAARLGFEDPELKVSTRELAREVVEQGFPHLGLRFDELEESRVHLLPRPIQFGDARPSRPIRFTRDEGGRDIGPPRYRENPMGEEDPLILISPAEARAISSTGFEGLPPGEAELLIHPADAAARGVVDGEAVRVENAVGSLTVRARISDRMRPGVLNLPKGLWRSATLDGWTSNAVIPAHVDPTGGGACYNDARVQVRRLNADT